MPPSDATITDLWFRSPLGLEELVVILGLADATFDAEDYWEWAVGTLVGVELDVTRTHRRPADSVDTRVFRLDNGAISEELRVKLVDRLRPVARGGVWWGRWVHREGNDFDLRPVGHAADG